jgi:DNA repair protein RadC
MMTPAQLYAAIKADPALAARVAVIADPATGPVVCTPETLVAAVAAHLDGRETEALVVVALDRRNRVIDSAILTTGTDAMCIVDPAQILRWVLTRKRSACSFAIAHNHPSGDPAPSAQDHAVTGRVQAGARAVGLKLIDHVIIGDGRHYSYAATNSL